MANLVNSEGKVDSATSDVVNDVCEKELILPLSSRFDSKNMYQMNHMCMIQDILQTQLIHGVVERSHRVPIQNKTNNKQIGNIDQDKNRIKDLQKRLEIFREICNINHNHSQMNDHTISIINKYIKPYLPNNRNKLIIDLVLRSIALKTPIIQFMVDIYNECLLKYNLTYNEVMEKSECLLMLPKDDKLKQLIRRVWSEYEKHIYIPIYQNISNDDDDDDDGDEDDEYIEKQSVVSKQQNKEILLINGFVRRSYDSNKGIIVPNDIINVICICYINMCVSVSFKPINMDGIIYYTSIIHQSIYKLNKVSQIDIVFVPELLDWIDGEYFKRLGIKYKKLVNEGNYLKQMMAFNTEQLDEKRFKRCIILIMASNDVDKDTVYIFEPLENNLLPSEILNYTEMLWILNTKSYILPGLSVKNSNSLCLSVHRHHIVPRYDDMSEQKDTQFQTERVYLSDGTCNIRIFKHNLKDILRRFCVVDIDCYPDIDWQQEIINKEFNDDYQYGLFVNTYFKDLKLLKPDNNNYLIQQQYDENRWSNLLCKYHN